MASNALALPDTGIQDTPAINYGSVAAPTPAQSPYPKWLTDLSGRGLATDWVPDAAVVPTAIQPTFGPMTDLSAPAAPVRVPQPGDAFAENFGINGGGQESASGAGIGDSSGDSSGADGGASGFAMGGMVTRNRLLGPDPAGPDQGYAALKSGEGVLTARAMKHYGPAFFAGLNRLAIPKWDADDRGKR